MPASICDPVSSALRLSLGAEDSQSSSLLDSRLYSSAKSVLLSKIEFEESGDYQSNVLDGLKSKYVVIRPKKPVLENKLLKKEAGTGNPLSGKNTCHQLILMLLYMCCNIVIGYVFKFMSIFTVTNFVNNFYYLYYNSVNFKSMPVNVLVK